MTTEADNKSSACDDVDKVQLWHVATAIVIAIGLCITAATLDLGYSIFGILIGCFLCWMIGCNVIDDCGDHPTIEFSKWYIYHHILKFHVICMGVILSILFLIKNDWIAIALIVSTWMSLYGINWLATFIVGKMKHSTQTPNT